MLKSTKNKFVIYSESFALFVSRPIPIDLLCNYMNDDNGEYSILFQEWIVNNMRDEISDWCTGIGIMESVEHLYKCAEENGNISAETIKDQAV